METAASVPWVTVVVPALNEEAFIDACLVSLAGQRAAGGFSGQGFDVVVVDNGSTDATAVRVRELAAAHPDLRVTLLGEPRLGVARARRAGAEWAIRRAADRGDELLIASTDADTVVHPEWIARIRQAFANDPACDYVAGPFTYSPPVVAQLGRLERLAVVWSRLRRILARMEYPETVGCNFAVRGSALAAIGGIPLLTIGEDLAVAELIINAGGRGQLIACSNFTSERRALQEPRDFLTGYRRMAAWGSRGERAFSPYRRPGSADREADLGFVDDPDVITEALHYFVRQHLIKPLCLVEQFRVPILEDALSLPVAPFQAAVERISSSSHWREFFLEDVILEVDGIFHDRVFRALQARLGMAATAADDSRCDLPFHVRAVSPSL